MVKSLLILASVCGLFSLTALLSEHYILFDLISHFRTQYLVLLVPVFILAVGKKHVFHAIVLFLPIAIHGYEVTHSIWPRSVNQTDDFSELRIFNANLLHRNDNYQFYLSKLNKVQPDIVALQEYTQHWHESLQATLKGYPYSVTHIKNSPFGIALFSRYPIAGGGVKIFREKRFPSIDVRVNVDGQLVRIVVIHPPPPTSTLFYQQRNALFEAVASDISGQDDHAILLGDLNATPWTKHFKKLEQVSGLSNARKGFGIRPSWPAGKFLLSIPIDHMLVSDRIQTLSFDTVDASGSDHHGILSDLRIYY